MQSTGGRIAACGGKNADGQNAGGKNADGQNASGQNGALGINGHYNYTRWLPVHMREIMNVRVKHPALYRQFADGFFTIAKTQNPFSMIGFDQKPEQQNKELKIHGGTLNLSDEFLFTEWAVAGPAIARVITEFEAGMLTRKNAVLKHHDPIPSIQLRFFAHTKALVIAFQEAGNPFDEDSHEVVIIDTREYAR